MQVYIAIIPSSDMNLVKCSDARSARQSNTVTPRDSRLGAQSLCASGADKKRREKKRDEMRRHDDDDASWAGLGACAIDAGLRAASSSRLVD